jgi:hypothetical protein
LNLFTVSRVEQGINEKQWIVTFNEISAMGITFPPQPPSDADQYPYGILLFSYVPNPSILAQITTQLIQSAEPFQVISNTAVNPFSLNRDWTLTLSYNDSTDEGILNFSASPLSIATHGGYPKVTSDLLQFFGFPQQVNLNALKEAQDFLREQQLGTPLIGSTNVSLQSQKNRDRNADSGGRLPVGNPPSGTLNN